MDVIDTAPRLGLDRRPPAAAVAVLLGLVAAGQVVALARTPALPDDVELAVPKEAFGFTSAGGDLTVSFQLRNDSDRSVRITQVGGAVTGLELVDVSASGSPVGFREVGAGPPPLPSFPLLPGSAALLSLTYRLTACDDVPADARPVPVSVRDGRARGLLRVALPQLPDDADGAADDDLVEWQRVLVRELCG